MVRRHPASMGVKRVWHLEPSLDNRDHVLRRRRRCRTVRIKRRRKIVAGSCQSAQTRYRPKWQPGAGGMCLHTILLDPKDRQRIFIVFRPRARSAPTTAVRRGSRSIAVCIRNTCLIHCGGRPLCSSASRCIIAAKHALHAKTLGRDAEAMTPGIPGARSAAFTQRFRFRLIFTRTSRTPFMSCRSRADSEHFSARWKVARLSQPHWWKTNGITHQRFAATRLLRECAARRMTVDSLDRAALYFGPRAGRVYGRRMPATPWKPIVRDLPASFQSKPKPAMILR